MPEVVTLGEAMVALRADGLVRLGGALRPSVAGAESNVAIGLARLGHAVTWAGVLGRDRFGDLVERTLRAEGVDLLLERDDAATGIVVFEERLPGVIGVDYARRGSAGSRLAPGLAARAVATGPRLLHLTGVTPALSPSARDAARAALTAARSAGIDVSLDVNHRARLWSRTEAQAELSVLARDCTVVIASEDEIELAAPAGTADPVGALLEAGVEEVVLTAGARGASRHAAGGVERVAAIPVPTVDPVGAGDAFAAGYLSGRLDGLPPSDRLARAAATGAFAVAARGDWEGAPRRADLALIAAPDGTTLR